MRALFVIFLIFQVVFCIGQNEYIRFNKLRSDNGLSQNSGREIRQDKFGFIWIATEAGLNRFDGKNIKAFRHDPENNSLANNYINSIETGRSEFVFIGTDGSGLNIYSILTDSFKIISTTTSPLNIANGFIYSLYEDNTNSIWIGTGNGLYKYNYKNNILHTIIKPDSIEPIYIRSISELNSKYLVVASTNGIYTIDKEDLNATLQNNTPQDLLSIITYNNELIISGGYSGIHLFTYKNDKLSETEKPNFVKILDGKIITSIFKEPDSKCIWLGTSESGIYKLDFEKNISTNYKPDPQLPFSLSSSSINEVFIDKNYVLWVGTSFDGINYTDIKNNKFKTIIPQENGKHILSISTICQSHDKLIWFGSTDGLYNYNIENNKLTNISEKFNKNLKFVTVLKEDSKGRIWVGTDNSGLYIIEGNNLEHYIPDKNNPNSISGMSIWGFSEDNIGNMYIAIWGGGICYFDNKAKSFKRYLNNIHDENTISTNNINAVLYNNEKVWVGTWNHGLNMYDISKNKWYQFKNNPNDLKSISHNIILSLFSDKNDNIWAGSYGGGLNKFNTVDSSFKKFTVKDGLKSNIIMGIQSDNNNSLLVFTDGGLSKLDLDDFHIRNYDFNDGLQSNEFSQNGIYKTFEKNILASGPGGFNLFNPDSIPENLTDPPIYINEMYINNISVYPFDPIFFPRKPLLIADTIQLEYKQNNFSFSFASLNFTNQSKVRYSCKLENYEDEWVDLGQIPVIRYTSISPGEYTLLYRSTNNDGIWISNPKKIVIIITPPFWQRSWFIILMIFSFFLFLFLFIKFRERKLKKEKRILETKVIERTHEISQQKEEIEAQRDEILAQRDLVTSQKEQIEHIHKEISQSIDYAKRIQAAILPDRQILDQFLSDNFILFKPKDKVSGDFYWWALVEKQLVITVADCTGHGVPGAFMAMLGSSLLRDIIVKEYITHPSLILKRLRKEIIHMLKQKGISGEQKDGMDMALLVINTETLEAQFAGANNPLYLVKSSKLQVQSNEKELDKLSTLGFVLDELKGDKMPIAIYTKMDAFTTKEFQLNKNDCIYMFSDGFPDQFGGPSGRKFMYKQFKEIILANSEKSMTEQKIILDKTINNWIGTEKQIDDITVVGLRI